MIQCQCKLSLPTAELTHFGGQKFRGNHPVWLSRGGASLEGKICLLNIFTLYTKNLLAKEQSVFVDIPCVIGCRDVCDS